MRRFVILACVLAVLPVGQLIACLWDSETLAQEREKFPGTLELITGKFLRHSASYYHWRLEDRQKKLQADPENDRLLDDLAVSYEKLGQYDRAIDVARSQLSRNPDRYESLANRGTFLIHAGKYQEGLEFIDRALEVNPDAHFGREKYQRFLVRYIVAQFPDGEIKFPLTSEEEGRIDFTRFLAQELSGGERKHLEKPEMQEAIKGVSGMTRFSKHDQPVLLEVLGNLLVSQYDPDADAKRLAARRYFMASYVVDDPESKKAYRDLAAGAVAMQVPGPRSSQPVKLADIEKQFKMELDEANKWFDGVKKNEQRWIESGADVDAKYADEYRREPEEVLAVESAGPLGLPSRRTLPLIGAAVCLAIAGVLYILRKRLLRRTSPQVSH